MASRITGGAAQTPPRVRAARRAQGCTAAVAVGRLSVCCTVAFFGLAVLRYVVIACPSMTIYGSHSGAGRLMAARS
eukprot:7391513-Prymnesium_polylepis.2